MKNFFYYTFTNKSQTQRKQVGDRYAINKVDPKFESRTATAENRYTTSLQYGNFKI